MSLFEESKLSNYIWNKRLSKNLLSERNDNLIQAKRIKLDNNSRIISTKLFERLVFQKELNKNHILPNLFLKFIDIILALQ